MEEGYRPLEAPEDLTTYLEPYQNDERMSRTMVSFTTMIILGSLSSSKPSQQALRLRRRRGWFVFGFQGTRW
jgi:hypothetical protein